jgi:ATP-dependent DNA helicase RecG
MIDLDARLDSVIGDRTAKPLQKAFGMQTVGDLLRHRPRRLLERGELTNLSELRVDDEVTVLAAVLSAREISHWDRKKARLQVIIGDETGRLELIFFGARSFYHAKELVPGRQGLFAGKVSEFRGTRQLAHPEYMVLKEGDELAGAEADMYSAKLIPIYPASKEARSWVITRAVWLALSQLDELTDPLPIEIRARHGLIGLDAAYRAMHQPESRAAWGSAWRRFKWDEAFGVQLVLAQRRHASAANPALARPAKHGGLLEAFDAQLPFELTEGQVEVGEELAAELAQPHPMQRLLQGEVGSGKTIVALRAMLQVIDAGGQAALLAPTEVLASQHARTIESMLGPLARAGQLGGADVATRVTLLTGSLAAAPRRKALLEAASGEAGIVVGTHALIQEHVQFADLGLVVVDEQHRFGVEQRDALRGKAAQPPHLLVMTATPIPRTVAMTVFGDLETSTLRQLPKGRAPIATSVVPVAEKPAWLDRAWQRIREEVADGRQAYVVCPRIGSSELKDEMAQFEADMADYDFEQEPSRRPPLAVVDMLEILSSGPLQGLRVAPLHGRLTSDEKDRTMLDFAAGRLDVLIATTVIEVGVDVPNASVMAILDADRFGVSQLHQLRGRVGRGGHPGLCLLATESPQGSKARERLDAVAATADGFELARLDVEQRREGDVLGVAQSGKNSGFEFLSLLRDEELIGQARAEATTLVAGDPYLAAHPLLAAQAAVLNADDRTDFLDKG